LRWRNNDVARKRNCLLRATPRKFPTRGYLKAVQLAYAPTQRAVRGFLTDRIYNMPSRIW